MRYAYERALIVGAGNGLSASLARTFSQAGLRIALAARDSSKLAALAAQTNAVTIDCDVADGAQVASLFRHLDASWGSPDVVVFNPSARVRGPFVDVDAAAVRDALLVSAYGAFTVAQEAARRMAPAGKGAIFFTGASAGIKGFPQSAAFAMGKFALRGLAESISRELQPSGIHVAHFVIDGGIRNPGRPEPPDRPDSMLDPDAIAQTYLDVLRQDRSAWSQEVTLRPFVERF